MNQLLLWLIIYGAALSKNFLYPGIAYADMLVFLASLIISIRLLIRQYAGLHIPGNVVNLLLLWYWIMLGCLFLANASGLSMNITEFMKSLAKFTFYSITYIIIYTFFVNAGIARVQKVMLNVLVLNGLIAIYIYIAMSTSLGLPYKFFWLGQNVTEATAYYHGTGFVRARGIFTEPAVFGFFQALGLAFILLKGPEIHKRIIWKLLIIIFSMILTISLVTYFLLGVIISLYVLDNLIRKEPVKLLRFSVILVPAMLLIFGVTPLGGFIQDGIGNRLSRVAQGQDTSAVERLIGSWEFPLSVAGFSPVFGGGLGNLETFYPEVSSTLQYKVLDNGNVTNILAYIFGALGPMGLALFLLLLIKLMAKNLSLGLVFLLAMFTTGNFLDAPFWLFLSLYNFPIKPTDPPDFVVFWGRRVG